MAVSSNSNTEPKVGAGVLSNFNPENKSNGNSSGGHINPDTEPKSNGNSSDDDINFKLDVHNPFDTKETPQPTFNTDDVFKPTLSGNLDIDLPKINNNNNSSNNTTYSNNSTEPTMTVDEVYGKSNNQPVVEKQGDYSASSNEKSNVETSTFGKQDEVSVTPLSVTENKGIVGNAAIQSVEGLDFQQKDKASVDVLDSKKKRDEVEAEDKANSMRDKLKANVGKAAEEEGGEDFRIGDRDEDVANAKAKVDQLTNEKAKYENEYKKNAKQLEIFYKKAAEKQQAIEQAIEQEDAEYQVKKANAKQLDAIGQQMQEFGQRYQEIANRKDNVFTAMGIQRDLSNLESEVTRFCEQLGVEPPAMSRYEPNAGRAFETFQSWEGGFIQENFDGLKDFSPNSITAYKAGLEKDHLNRLTQFTDELDSLVGEAKLIEDRQEKLRGLIADNEKKSTAAQKAYDDLVSEGYVGAEAVTEPTADEAAKSNAEEAVNLAKDAINNSKDATPEQKAQAEEAITNLEDSRKALEAAAAAARSGNPADMVAYQKALEQYNKNLKEAQKIGNRWTQTDFNKDYTRAVAQANDFKVTLADGTEMEYSDFATEEATKSPQYANAMYEKKAADYEKNGHPILAKIERWKAEWSQTWLGSKLTFADNKVRDQFNQMAKTDMRATYAAYNNVLNDETGKYSEADKAEASKAINQAKALMTASAALQASTGFLSGIGDSMEDGISGTTDPGALNAWQKTLNTVDNIIRITLGLGISPAANKAYQNMYYMAGDKVNNSLLFNKDFDSDGFVLCQEYGNNAATGMIAGAGELAVGIAMMFNPASMSSGLNLITDSVQTFLNGLYGVRNEAEKSQKYTQEVLEYFKEAEDIAESSGNEEAVQEITNAITQIENFELKSDEVGNIDNWLEGSGSNTASNEKFNQSLTYDEWLKLIEADPTMREFAKSLTEKKKDKNAQKDNADTGVNS